MEEYGNRLRERARSLGLKDIDVARRLGLSQGRYANYVNGNREPDLSTFVKICRVLGTSPNEILGFEVGQAGSEDFVRARAFGTIEAMSPAMMRLAVIFLEAMVSKQDEISDVVNPKTPINK